MSQCKPDCGELFVRISDYSDCTVYLSTLGSDYASPVPRQTMTPSANLKSVPPPANPRAPEFLPQAAHGPSDFFDD